MNDERFRPQSNFDESDVFLGPMIRQNRRLSEKCKQTGTVSLPSHSSNTSKLTHHDTIITTTKGTARGETTALFDENM